MLETYISKSYWLIHDSISNNIIVCDINKKTYHTQHVYFVVSYKILGNQFGKKMEKLNLKIDVLMLMVYIKNSSNLLYFLGPLLENRRWNISL